ncbi:hypothetical protein ET495_10445 [Xylanimonas allomyrinae]|uniref:Type IV toxin-antitoxin system AbiEi family antitoxin domain-containing protein n=1 Tax=Xylanimonas allomyrinae TaxID=2509459 RepID=A0A4P6EZU3_9MICO|nr:hypothetical protein [Xylanimonas allomyrinae]QAY63598.1 hypothetical protein ET495_10445 [Xylanimonas allomyrinae]
MEGSPRLLISREHDRDELRRDLAAGRLVRVRRGAYAPGPASFDAQRARVLAVHRQLVAPHVFGFASAAVVHGLHSWNRPEQVHVVVGSRPSGRSAADIARHTAELGPAAVTTVDGLPVTTLTRTVVDCALTMHPMEALVIADGAMNRLEFDRDAALAQVAARRRPNGKARADWVLRNAAAGTRSVWETWLRYLPLREGFPTPVVEPPVVTRLGVMHPDIGWPDLGLYVEFDGRVKYRDDGLRPGHSAERELLAEKRRFDAIRETGVNPLRVMAADGPYRYMERLRSRLPPHLRSTLRVNPGSPFRPSASGRQFVVSACARGHAGTTNCRPDKDDPRLGKAL